MLKYRGGTTAIFETMRMKNFFGDEASLLGYQADHMLKNRAVSHHSRALLRSTGIQFDYYAPWDDGVLEVRTYSKFGVANFSLENPTLEICVLEENADELIRRSLSDRSDTKLCVHPKIVAREVTATSIRDSRATHYVNNQRTECLVNFSRAYNTELESDKFRKGISKRLDERIEEYFSELKSRLTGFRIPASSDVLGLVSQKSGNATKV